MTAKISIIVPCFNEEGTIGALVGRLRLVLQDFRNQYLSFEVVFVDDGSTDRTAAAIRDVRLPSPSRLIALSRNFGKEAAVTAGLDVADGDAVIIMDADLQHPPERIPDLIERWREGVDVVYFYKRSRRNEGLAKSATARLFYRLINFGSQIEIPENAGDFRLLDRRAADILREMPERARFMKGMYAWVGFNQSGIPLDVDGRHDASATRFTPIMLFGLAMDGLTAFTTAPIRMISLLGTAVSLIGILYLIWIVGEWLTIGSPFSGFATIVVLVVFFGGLQLVCLGIIGEYIGKTLLEAKRRPAYVVRDNIVIPASDE